MKAIIAGLLLTIASTANAGWVFNSTDDGQVHYGWNYKSVATLSIGCGGYDIGNKGWHFVSAILHFEDGRTLPDQTTVQVKSNIAVLNGAWTIDRGNLVKDITETDIADRFESMLKNSLKQIGVKGGNVTLDLLFVDGSVEQIKYLGGGFLGVATKMGESCLSDNRMGSDRSSGSVGRYGDTPLHRAVRNNDASAAARIITTSPKSVLCARNSLGQVPAQLADILGHTEIWSMLYAANALKHQCER